MKLAVFLCTLVALPVMGGSVPTAKPEEIGMSADRLRRVHESIQRHVDAGAISGAVTLVSRRGKIAHFEAHGLMDIESKKPMATDTIFRLASMSKPVTGVAVMMLVEEGKLRLNDPVSKFIPQLKEMKVAVARGAAPQFYVVPAEREITIRDLLTHTSGLGSAGITSQVVAKLMQARQPADTLADFTSKLGEVPLEFQPGSLWRYSGRLGIDLLGRVVEVVSGLTFDQFLKQRLFEPLGMKDTSFFVEPGRRGRLVTLYQRGKDGKLEKNPNQEALMSETYFSGAGGLTSTAEDYLQFAQMLVNGGQLNGKRYLGPRTVELLASQPRGGYVQWTARPAGEGNGVRADCRSGAGLCGGGAAGVQWQFRLGRGFRHAGVDGPEGEDGEHRNDPDAGFAGAAGLRERGDAGDCRLKRSEDDLHDQGDDPGSGGYREGGQEGRCGSLSLSCTGLLRESVRTSAGKLRGMSAAGGNRRERGRSN